MENQRNSWWAPVSHTDTRTQQEDTTPTSAYDMYPADWAVASETDRDAEETRQRRGRESNGGMGFGSDFGAEYNTSAVVPLRPLSAGVAAVNSEVRLG